MWCAKTKMINVCCGIYLTKKSSNLTEFYSHGQIKLPTVKLKVDGVVFEVVPLICDVMFWQRLYC